MKIFVYGTLMQREGNNHFLSTSLFLGRFQTKPSFELVDLGPFPAMVIGGKTSIKGEVYEVDRKTLSRLDRLEGCPTFYQRQRVLLEGGMTVFAYLMRREDVLSRPLILSGDWRERR